jgi:hypothetical protein
MHTQQPTPATPGTDPMAVMLLSLWAPPAARWHARLVDTEARIHEFDNPFELARFVARASSARKVAATDAGAPAPGLR